MGYRLPGPKGGGHLKGLTVWSQGLGTTQRLLGPNDYGNLKRCYGHL